MKNYNLEIELITSCARTNLNTNMISKLRDLLNESLDWDYIINTARTHKLFPLLYRNLNSLPVELLPFNVMELLKNHFRAATKSNLYLTKELIKVLNLLEQNKIFVMPYKGPILALILYNNLGLREYGDIDLLVLERDALKVKEILIQEGYTPFHKLHPDTEDAYLKYDYSYELDNEDGIHLEIHWGITASYFLLGTTLDNLSWHYEKTTIFDKPLPVLDLEDLLLVLCLNGAKDAWESFSLICDIAQIIDTKKNLDWDLLLTKAKKLKCKRMLLLGLYLANNFLQAKLPNNILKIINSDKDIKHLGELIKNRIFYGKVSASLFDNIGDFQIWIRDSLFQKLRYLFCFMFYPSLNDLMAVTFPKDLSVLYYFFRPIRLIGKYFFRKFGGSKLSEFVATPHEIIKNILEVGQVDSNDVIYDIGCGDGRILVEAAKRFGARGVGIDIDSKLLDKARVNAKKEGVSELIEFVQKDAMEVDLSDATVVIFYLSDVQPVIFKNKLLKELKSGTRVVAHCCEVQNWSPDKVKLFSDDAGFVHTLRLWKIGENKKPSSKQDETKEQVPVCT
ncbi:MAG: nucleotidyltransferase family protein [Candidatus Melainabacteria bacterium]|nr:nucleotidyltransferase family protein [Candidatus Melainabacteria bacterium]